jgi:hypothetical protein
MKQNQGHDNRRNLWDKTWKDRDGKVVMWQTPNAWLISWAGFTVVSLFFSGRASDVFSWIASAALIIWSLLEIFSGVNYYRRVLGIAVLAYAAASLLKSV